MNRLFRTGCLVVGLMAQAIPVMAAEGVVLKIDFGSSQQLKYAVDYTAEATYKQNLTASSKSTKIRGVLSAAKKDSLSLLLKVDSAVVASAIFKDEISKELQAKLLKSEYALSLSRGYPSIDSTAELPAEDILGWDFYRQLARLVPTLPSKAVKPGFTWERTLSVPMMTSAGKVSCEVFRSYTFKKLSGDTAEIEWKFRYAAKEKLDSAKIMNQIPVSGTGSGSALIDIKKRAILNAQISFATPVAVVGSVQVSWQEHADFRLLGTR